MSVVASSSGVDEWKKLTSYPEPQGVGTTLFVIGGNNCFEGIASRLDGVTGAMKAKLLHEVGERRVRSQCTSGFLM